MEMAISSAAERNVGLSTPLPRYSGYPWWHALLVPGGKEERAAKRLQRLHVFAYLPTYAKRIGQRCRNNRLKLYPIIHGMLFVPVEMMETTRRDEMFELCHVIGYLHATDGLPALISKADIETIRDLEARENLPAPKVAALRFEIGQKVRFKERDLAEFWGKGLVKAIAKNGRITVNVAKLLGRTTPVEVWPSEIEAM
jgi:hypothetical protein